MKFSISQTELQNALSIVLKGVSTRSTLPILSGIYLQAQGDTLTFQATNLEELSIQYSTSALVEEEGRTVLPGKLFNDIVKNLPDAAVHVQASTDSAIITCDNASFSVKALDPDDFPGFPHVDTMQEVSIPFNEFCSMAKKVSRVVSKDMTHVILTGVLMTLEGREFKMVATDSYRLAVTEYQLENSQADDFQAVVSGTFLNELASLPKSKDPIRLALAENQIVVTYENTIFINRRIEGTFPNYKQLLPASCETRVCMDTSHLVAAVRRASLLSQASAPVRFDVNAATQSVQLSSTTQDVGSAQELISCQVEGADVEIAFNYAYVLEGLSAVSTEKVYLEINSSMKPGIFKAEESENYLYLVMPVRIS